MIKKAGLKINVSLQGVALGGSWYEDVALCGDCTFILGTSTHSQIATTYKYWGKCGLELIDFGSTWTRKQESALDHALIKKPEANKDYFKIQIDYLLRPCMIFPGFLPIVIKKIRLCNEVFVFNLIAALNCFIQNKKSYKWYGWNCRRFVQMKTIFFGIHEVLNIKWFWKLIYQ